MSLRIVEVTAHLPVKAGGTGLNPLAGGGMLPEVGRPSSRVPPRNGAALRHAGTHPSGRYSDSTCIAGMKQGLVPIMQIGRRRSEPTSSWNAGSARPRSFATRAVHCLGMCPLLPTMLNYTEVALTWRELGHGQPRPDDVVAIVRQFHRDSLLTVLIRLNLALTHARGPSQEDMVRKGLVPQRADAVVRFLRQGPPTKILFHEGQVLNAIGLALLHCPQDEGLRLWTMGELELLTRALLMVSALMFPEGQEDLRRARIFSTTTRGEG